MDGGAAASRVRGADGEGGRSAAGASDAAVGRAAGPVVAGGRDDERVEGEGPVGGAGERPVAEGCERLDDADERDPGGVVRVPVLVRVDGELEAPVRPEPTRVDGQPPLSLDLRAGSIRTIVWATGFRPDYSWLRLPVLDRKGRLRHDGGVVTDAPGVYAIGLNLLRRRKSSFIHGAEDDARELTDHLAAHIGAP